MSSTLPRSRCRTALVAAALVCTSLASCSSEAANGSREGEGSSSGEVDAKRVSAAGISFEVPEGWETLDAGELAEGAGENSQLAEWAEGLGITPDQLEQTVSSMDLFLVTDEGLRAGSSTTSTCCGCRAGCRTTPS